MPGLGQGPGDPEVLIINISSWIPAFAGMTDKIFGIMKFFTSKFWIRYSLFDLPAHAFWR
jgi:hypothetical protein